MMDLWSWAGRWLVATVLLQAGGSKLARRARFERALAAFGLPAGSVPGLAWALPVAELAIAVALLVEPWAPAASFAALGLLAVFTLAILVQLARGRRPGCACFGEASPAPIGGPTLLRNLLLIAATLLAAQPAAPIPPAVAALLALLAGQTALSLYLLRAHGELRRRVEELEARPDTQGLPVGTPAPAFTAADLSGRLYTLRELLPRGQELLLFFHEPGCEPCAELLPRLRSWQTRLAGRCAVVVVGRGGSAFGRARELPELLAVWQEEAELSELFKVRSLPSAVLVSAEGLIRAPLAIGGANIEALLEASFRD